MNSQRRERNECGLTAVITAHYYFLPIEPELPSPPTPSSCQSVL